MGDAARQLPAVDPVRAEAHAPHSTRARRRYHRTSSIASTSSWLPSTRSQIASAARSPSA